MNGKVKRQLGKARLWIAFVLIAVFVWGVIFYWIAQPTREEKLEIWLSADFMLKSELTAEIERECAPYGIKKCVANSYNPDDTYFAQAFAMRARSVDIYIMTAELAASIAEANIFKPLNMQFDNAEYLEINGENCGVKFVGDYYVFVNSASKKDGDLLKAAIDVLLDVASTNSGTRLDGASAA